MQTFLSVLKSRLPVLAGIAAFAIALGVATHMLGDVTRGWKALAIPALSPNFGDTGIITYSIDVVESGKDPYTDQSNPWNLLYNYPPIWLNLRYIGISYRTTSLIGWTLGIITFGACLLLFRANTLASGVVAFLSVTARPLLFAIERANTDILMFSLLVFGFFLIGSRNTKVRLYLTGLLIVFLTILKIYPVAAVAVMLRNRKGLLTAFIVGIAAVAIAFGIGGHNVVRAIANTPQINVFSFGAYPFFVTLSYYLAHPLVPIIDRHHGLACLGALLLSVLCVLAGARYEKLLSQVVPPLNFESVRGRIAISSLAIYCLAFLWGSSFNYRLIFLLPALVYLVEDLNKEESLRSITAALLILILFWCPSHYMLMHELLDGLVFAVISAWLGTTLLTGVLGQHFLKEKSRIFIEI